MKKESLNQNEQGRSMVEMLGVLAIMGLLTIIGIAGFRYAINKHYANQTVDRLMRRAVVVAGQANFGQNLSLHEFDENDGEYKITLLDPTNNESFTMQVEDIPQEVCQQILGMDWKLAKMNPDNCSEETINFMFLNELTDCSTCVAESVDCPPDDQLECGSCSVVRGFLDKDADCEGNENGPNCVRGKCVPCENNFYRRDSSCYPCQEDSSNYFVSESTKHNCLGSMFYSSKNRWMYGCKIIQNSIAQADALSCKACTNLCFSPNDNICYPADEKVTGHKRNADGTCSNCVIGFYGRGGSECYPCTENSSNYFVSETDKHNCLGSMFFRDRNNRWLVGCEVAGTSWGDADEQSCAECTNSEGVKNHCYLNGTCYLVGEGETYRRVSESDGTCVANE